MPSSRTIVSLIEDVESILAIRSEHLSTIPDDGGAAHLEGYLQKLIQFASDRGNPSISEPHELEFYVILTNYPCLRHMHFASIAAKARDWCMQRWNEYEKLCAQRPLTVDELKNRQKVKAALVAAERTFHNALNRCMCRKDESDS